MKSDDLGKYKNKDQEASASMTLFTIIWITFWTIVSYYYGKLHFDVDNIEKSYEVIETYIKRDIKALEKEKFG